MINYINSWAQGIIVSVIIVAIIEIILPEGTSKKYVKVILGIYIMFSIIYPIVNGITKENINLNTIITGANIEINNDETANILLDTDTYIENTYKENLRTDITKKIEEKGYIVLDLKINIETLNQEMYGQINSIVLKVGNASIDNKNTNEEVTTQKDTKEIQEIKIDISNKKENTKINIKEVSQDEINNLKEYLYNLYSIEKERIHINE